MPVAITKNFGTLEFEAGSVLDFPRGLPGFADARTFVPVRQPENDPLLFLQSLDEPSLCFLTAPVLAVDPDYRLDMEPEDLELVGLPRGRPRIGTDVMCLTVLALREEGPSANLLAPVVVNLANRKCVQAVVAGHGYSHRHPLCADEAVACS